MAPPARDTRGAELRRRILSAAILLPVVLLAVQFGGAAMAVLVIATAGILGWEWSRLCGFAPPHIAGPLLTVGAMVAVATAYFSGSHAGVTLAMALIGAAIALWAVAALPKRRLALWFGLGFVCIGVPWVALLWLRSQGAEFVFWVLFVTWAADIGAFFVGRSVGGPKLAPAISPNKTWSGFFGGLVAAVAVGALYVAFHQGSMPGAAALAAVPVALAAVVGDLAESGLKRHFGAKDAGNLIPGHGGLFDRVDALLLTAPAAALLLIAGWRWL